MKSSIARLAVDLMDFFLPVRCAACEEPLVNGEEVICLSCLIHLPLTGFEGQRGNPVEKQFWGKVPVGEAMALLHFTKGEKVQRILHKLKYGGRPEIGIKMGRWCAGRINSHSRFAAADVIIPVPLHKMKERRRGFNQSAMFARGLSEGMGISYRPHGLVRLKNTGTQTRKSRFDRSGNVADVFMPGPDFDVHGKSVILVDDVITTGSTLTASAMALLSAGAERISIAAIAYAAA